MQNEVLNLLAKFGSNICNRSRETKRSCFYSSGLPSCQSVYTVIMNHLWKLFGDRYRVIKFCVNLICRLKITTVFSVCRLGIQHLLWGFSGFDPSLGISLNDTTKGTSSDHISIYSARSLASSEYWIHFAARFGSVHAFVYNSAEL